MTPPPRVAAGRPPAFSGRTFVVCRYLGPAFFAGHPTHEPELEPLGTVEARTAAEARALAAASWPNIPRRALRVRTARAAGVAHLAAALARDGARPRGRPAADA